MRDPFQVALAFALKWEGGYSNHPADSGGETNKGVTHAVYDSYRRSKGLPRQSVRLISEIEVHEIYHQRYWLAADCQLLPEKLAIAHFDWAVNAGVNRAVKTLQQAIGVQVDGVMGPKTKAAAIAAIEKRGEKEVSNFYCNIRERYYRRWAVGSQAVFLNGWMNRLNSLRSEIT